MIKPSANQSEVFQTFTIAIPKREKTAIQSDGSLQSEINIKLQSISEVLDNDRRNNIRQLNKNSGNTVPRDPGNIEEKHIGILEKMRLSRNRNIPRGE